MASQTTFIGYVPLNVKAATDLRAHQYKAVQATTLGVLLADTRSVAYTGTYILALAANSGEACAVQKAPNLARCIASGAIGIGAWVECQSANGLMMATSAAKTEALGVALTATANSGEFVTVDLRR